jgi:hypothetical protein
MADRKTLFVAGLSMLLPVAGLTAPMAAARAGTVPDDRLRAVLVNDATCLVQYDRPRVDAFLKMTPGTPRIERESRLIGGSACLQGDRLSYEPGQLRGALFIALYQSQYATGDPGVVDPAQEATAWPQAADVRTAAVQQFATCAVRADPEDARRIVLASPESSDESAGIDGLRPHLDGCFPKGGSIIFNRMALSGLLAEALYRLAPASPVSGI